MFGERKTEGGRILPVTRRRFVQGVAAGAAITAYRWSGLPALGDTAPPTPAVLSGKYFELTIDSLPVNFTGRRAVATAVNGSVPGPHPEMARRGYGYLGGDQPAEGAGLDPLALLADSRRDGWGSRIELSGIAPGETFHYRFPVLQNGTAWYHSHSRFQEQTGLIGPLIIDPRGEDPIPFDREYVVLLTDWTDTNPERCSAIERGRVTTTTSIGGRGPNFFSEAKQQGLGRDCLQVVWRGHG